MLQRDLSQVNDIQPLLTELQNLSLLDECSVAVGMQHNLGP